MKQIFILILALAAASQLRAQESIMRLLPRLQEALGEQFCISSAQRSPDSWLPRSFHDGFDVPRDSLPASLLDSLCAAFERELPLATESNRFQSHRADGDTLSYSLVYGGSIVGESETANFNTAGHRFKGDLRGSAILDAFRDRVRMWVTTFPSVSDSRVRPTDYTPIRDFFRRTVARPGTERDEVAFTIKERENYSIYDSHLNDKTLTVGTRYRLRDADGSLLKKFRQLVLSYCGSGRKHKIYVWKSCIRATDPETNETFLAERTPDGTLHLLHVTSRDGILISGGWKEAPPRPAAQP